ncbi:MAG: 7-carboxy-7-deazaguanine synthase QueE, partial [Clostridia bacterium]
LGIPKVFIRTQGCTVGCKFCDSPQSLNHTEGKLMSVEEVLVEIRRFLPYKRVTITGGSPIEQIDLLELVKTLRKESYFVTLEESGQVYNKEVFTLCNFLSIDAKSPSSGVSINWDSHNKILQHGNVQIKFVVKNEDDLVFVNNYYKKFRSLLEEPVLDTHSDKLVITPCWELEDEMGEVLERTKEIQEAIVLLKLPVRVIIQQHKLLYGAIKTGV